MAKKAKRGKKSKRHKRIKKIKKAVMKRGDKILLGVLVLIFLLIILISFSELQEIGNILKQANYSLLIIAAVVQFAVFASLAGFYKVILGKASFFHFFRTAIAMLFIDHAIPSFSASGNALLYHTARQRYEERERSALVVAMNFFFNITFFFILLICGLVYLFFTKKILSTQTSVVIILAVVFIFALITRVLWSETGKRHFNSILSGITKKWPRARKKILRATSDFHKAKKLLKPRELSLLSFFIFLSYIFKLSVIFLVFLSLGNIINPGILVTGYVIALVLSTISYVRIGVYEASMAIAYSTLGLEYNLALTATLVYRAIAFWLPFLIGFLLLRGLIRKKQEKEKKEGQKKKIKEK